MERFIEDLWKSLPSEEYRAQTVIHRLSNHFESALTTEEKDVSLHLLFQEERGLKSFLDSASSITMQKVTIDILDFLNYLVEFHFSNLDNYVLHIRNIAMSYIQRTSTPANEKERAFEILINLVRKGPWNSDLQITAIVSQLLNMASHSLSKPTILCKVYNLVGALAECLPHDINFSSQRLFNAMILDLEYQFVHSRKVEFSIIEGCFNGLNGYLHSFPLDSSDEFCDRIAECIFKILKLKDCHRKTAHRAALNLLANHGDQFHVRLVSDCKLWHDILCDWLAMGKEERIAGKQAMLTFYHVIANFISRQDGPKDTLDFFCNHFKKQFEDSKDIDIAVKGFGLFARAIKVYLPDEIPAIFNIIAQKSHEDSKKSNHHKLADYLDSLSMFSSEAGVIHSLQLAILQRLSVQLICQYAEEEHPIWQRVMVDAVICTLLRLRKCGAALDSFMSVVVHQGIIRSVSHPVVEDAYILRETGQKKVVTYENYLTFWQTLLTLDTSSKRFLQGLSIDQKRKIARDLVNKILNSVQDLIERLDLSLQESAESIYHCNVEKCMEASNPQDFTVLVNLTNFTIDLLNSLPDQSLLANWFTPLLLYSIKMSSKHPLVSSFYKLLANIVKIAEKLNYFEQQEGEMEDVEWRSTLNLLSGFLYDVISRQAQYRGDLQVSCLRLMLATPSCIAPPLLSVCVPAFQSVFHIGCSMLSLAHEGLQTLSRWNQDLPGGKMKSLLKAVLPSFDSLLQTRDNVPIDEDEDNDLYGMTLVRTVLKEKKKKKLWKHKTNFHADTELVQLQKEVVVFLSTLDSTSCLSLLDGSEERVGVTAWQKERLLKFPMPFADMKVDISLDDLLPRLAYLAVNCSDRQTKTAACESLHAVIMYMLGKEKQLETAHQGHLTSLWSHLFPTIFSLACDVDIVVSQLFKPLGEQLAHWYSSKMNEGSQQAEAFLRATLDGITHQTDAALRDYSATCLHEYVEWSRKQGNMIAKVSPVLKFVLNLCHHPCPQKRIGASLAFNSMYTVLREDIDIVDEFWIELLYGLVTGLSLCSIMGEDNSTEGQIDKSLQHILRVLMTYSNKFNLDSPRRRIPKEFTGRKLWDVVRWLLKYCTALNSKCRHSCMKLVDCLASKVPNCRSTKDLIEIVVSTEGVESLLLIAEGETELSTTLPNAAPWDQALAWVCSLLASMESYLWLIEMNLPPASLFSLSNSKITQALMHFLEKIVDSPVSKTALWRPKALEHFNYAKCTTIVRIIDFFTAVLDGGQGLKLKMFWSSNFWKFLTKVCLWPSNLGFDSTSKSVEEKLPAAVQRFLISLTTHAPVSAVNDLKVILKEYISLVVPDLLDRFHDAVRGDRALTQEKEIIRGLRVLQSVFDVTQIWSGFDGERSLVMVFDSIVEPISGSAHCAPVCLNPTALLYAQSMLEFYFSTHSQLKPLMIKILDKSPLCQQDLKSNLTHGEHFFSCFEAVLVQRFLEVPQQCIDILVECLSPDVSSQHLSILPAILKCHCSVNSTSWCHQQEWKEFVTWSKTDLCKEIWLIMLLNCSVELVADFNSFKNICYISSWIAELLKDASKPLSLKADLLYSLSIVCATSEASDVKNTLLTLKNQHFPVSCSEFKPGSEELSTFKTAYEALLQSLVLTGSLSVLEVVIRTMSVDPYHYCRHLLPTTLENYMAQLLHSQNGQVQSLEYVYSMFESESRLIDCRARILNEFLLKMMQSASLTSQVCFSVSIINKLVKKITEEVSNRTDETRQKQKLLSLVGSWKLLQQIHGFPVRSLLEERGSELVQAAFSGSGKNVVSGKELNAQVIKSGLEAFQRPLHFAGSDTKELYRQYLCAVYNTLVTLFCNLKNQPSDLKFYNLLFCENSRKFWRRLVDERKCYMEPFQATEHLKNVEKVVTIRRKVSEDTSSSQNVSQKSLRLFHTASQAGSLETDITRFDFTYARVMKPTYNHEASNDKSVIMLENDSLNNHECMPTVCSLIHNLVDCGISPTPVQGTPATLPDWMDSFKNSLNDASNPRNSQIFILRVILNCETHFSAYAEEWMQPILDCVLRICLRNGISYLLGDIVCMLAKWNASHKSVILDKSQVNVLFSYLVSHCPNSDRTVLRYHLELIKTMLEVWRQFIDPPHETLFNMLNNRDARIGINLTAIMLFHELTPWTTETKKAFMYFLMKNLDDNVKEVFKASGETLGMCLRHLGVPNGGQVSIEDQKFVDDLEEFLQGVYSIKRDCDRFFVLLDSVSESYPQIIVKFVSNILLYLNQTGGSGKAVCLNLVGKRLKTAGFLIDGKPYQELKGCGLLALVGDQNSDVQVKALQILCDLSPSLEESELYEVVHAVSLVTPYCKGPARKLAHEISLSAFDRYLPLHECSKLSDMKKKCFDESKAVLLLGLIDSNTDLQKKSLSMWTEEERLPQNVTERLMTIFSLLYSPLTEQYFLSYSVPLILAGSKTTTDFNSTLFSHALDECEFEDMHLLTSWRVKNAHMAPLYAQTLSSQKTLQDSSSSLDSSYPLLATQSSLIFQPTADVLDGMDSVNSITKPRSSVSRSSFLFSQETIQSSKPAIRGNFKQGSDFGRQQLNLTDPSDNEKNIARTGIGRTTRYFGKKTAESVFSKENVKRAKRREEMWRERKLRREGQVAMHRKYRLGDLPDIQIKFSDLINPLSELSKHDSIISRKIMVSLFVGVKESIDSVEKSNDFKKLSSSILNEVLNLSNSSCNFEPSTVGACLEIAYHCQLSLDSHLVTEVAVGSNLLSLGVLLLEAAALEAPDNENIWLDLAELYDGLGERDVAHSTLLHNFPLDTTAKAALKAHAEEQWQKAKTLYANALKETKYDNFYESCFECMAVMSDWDQMNKVIRDQVDGELDNLWDNGWYEKKLLPRLLHSEVLGLVQGSEDKNKFLSTRFSEELSIICLEKKKFPQSRFYGSKSLSKFVDEWSELNPLFRKRREIMLLSINSITDVMGFFVHGKELQSVEDCTKFLRNLEKVSPVSQDSLLLWETRLTYRMACMKYMPSEMKNEVKMCALKMQLGLVEAALQQGNQNFAKKYILNMKEKIDSASPALRTRWLIARCSERHQWAKKEQNNVIRLDNLIKIWLQLDQVLASSDLDSYPDLSVIAHSVESNLALTIKETLSADPQSLITLKGRGEGHNWLCGKLQIQASHSRDEAINILESLGLNSLLHSKNIAKKHKDASCFPSEQTAEAYLQIAQYCRKVLEKQQDSSTSSTYARHLVKATLSAMKCGSNRARQLFPILLQLPTLSSHLANDFLEKSSSIPVWMFLGWIPQLLAMLDSQAEKLVSPLLRKIAKTYPNAISYPYNISKEKINTASKRAAIESLGALLVNSSQQTDLIRAFSCLTYPSTILKEYISKVIEAVKLTPSDWAPLREICEEFSLNYSDNNRCSQFIGKFFHSFKKQNIFHLFNALLAAIEEKNVTAVHDTIETLKSKFKEVKKLDERSIKPYSKLKDFSPWLAEFSSSKKNFCIEIPGQYNGDQKPNPERHITISGFNDTVLVMSSIRKPVKLTIIGSDAQSRNFLVKYGEDLRQDERVQQLLGLMNGIFSNNHICRDGHLTVVTYKVMPLSTRLGIIEWVDKTSCLKDVMMSSLPLTEQKKDELLGNLRLKQCIWFQKYHKAQGQSAFGYAHKLISREASVEEFHKLLSCSEPDMLRKGLQLWSSSAEAFYWLRHSFITSYSTLCIAHWILGVGDRHLLNCLVSQTNGQCIGIDFGHVFGSATLNLPVPELIPFRLTSKIVNVAQPYGTKESPNLTWLPVVKIEQAKKKLEGNNPVAVMREDLESKIHSDFKDGYLKTLNGTSQHNIRAKLADSGLTPRQQVECLIDLATDPNVLVKTYGGWDPWMRQRQSSREREKRSSASPRSACVLAYPVPGSRTQSMSLVPLLFRDWWDEQDHRAGARPSRLLDQHFGLGLTRDDLNLVPSVAAASPLHSMLQPHLRSHYLRPWRLARQNSGSSSLAVDNNQFQVSLDVQQFAPSELSVKVSERSVLVEGCHEERADEHGYISRQFKRRYLLPEDADTEAVSSALSSDGVLTITVPNKKQLPPGERAVPITQTGAPALSPAPQPPAPYAPFPAAPAPAPASAPAAPSPAPGPRPASTATQGGPVTTNIHIQQE
ncbi:DNA-dependent protein kinase catalytic subunit [Frankliniella fusca]|uniref:DNA-dependent protein kinase catalytic subunit n=1 Tax=Frankliniella fusca TaxID=407009 RepID=A0AAE1H9X5_9NEOP|nr:DNA-dependent protein kinase catalytic subunit [Frankliniella fusca]